MRFLPVLLLGCPEPEAEPCVVPDVALYCVHDELIPGPSEVDPERAECEVLEPKGSEPCGSRFKVIRDDNPHSGVEHYFEKGVHIATEYWSDDPIYCGGYSFWYGEPLLCF